MKHLVLLTLTTALLPGLARAETGPSVLVPTEGGLTLPEVYARAADTSPQVKKSDHALATAKADADVAYTAFFPRLDLSAGYNRLSEVEQQPLEFDPGFGDPIVIDGAFPQFLNTWDLRANLVVPASDFFLVNLHGYRSVKGQVAVHRLERRARREAAALQAGEAFLGLVRARAMADIAESSQALLKSLLADLQQLVGAGLATEVDTLRIEARLAAGRVSLAQAGGGIRLAERALATLIGETGEGALMSAEDLRVDVEALSPPPPLDQVLAAAEKQRPELMTVRQVIGLHEENLALQSGRLYPRLSLIGSANYSNPNQRVFPSTDEFRGTWMVGAQVSWSPNDFVSALSSRRHARRDLKSTEADLEALVDGIALEVRQAHTAYTTTLEQLRSATEGLSVARKSYEATVQRQQAGDASSTDLLDVEGDLRRAELQLASATLDYHLARIRLDYVQGQLFAAPLGSPGVAP